MAAEIEQQQERLLVLQEEHNTLREQVEIVEIASIYVLILMDILYQLLEAQKHLQHLDGEAEAKSRQLVDMEEQLSRSKSQQVRTRVILWSASADYENVVRVSS